MAIDSEVLARLKAQHGDVYSITKCGQEIVFRPCNADELDRFLAMAEQDKPQACIQLVASCILHPTIDVFEALRQKKPGILYGDHGLVSVVVRQPVKNDATPCRCM